jgi:hypothetical protein
MNNIWRFIGEVNLLQVENIIAISVRELTEVEDVGRNSKKEKKIEKGLKMTKY